MDTAWFDEREARIPKGEVRTRFAPSPTGYMHVGNLRTALYAWCIARRAGGKFILRIEDTDRARQVAGAVDAIYKTLADCGIDHDEGPDVGGPAGPYVQTERWDLYLPYAQRLVELGHAYYCFCEKAEAEGDAGAFDRAADPCRDLDPGEVRRRLNAGEPWVIRQKIPSGGVTAFHDEIYGDIAAPNGDLDDQVLIKRDGLPTYNFANVVDDHLMGVTHVVRGSEYLSSAPKYNLLYQALGWEIPKYVHCAPVMRDAHNKMSKRHGDPSYEDLVAEGYLTEAIVNYVALLGWAPEGERELYTIRELAEVFDLRRISKSPAIFDREKLTYFNAAYIRAMAPEDFARTAEPWIRRGVKNPAYDVGRMAALLQQRTEKLSDIPEKLDFFDALPDYPPELYVHRKSKCDIPTALQVLELLRPRLAALEPWTEENILELLTAAAAERGCKNALIMWPVRVAATGKAVTPGGAVEILRILGREETLRRVDAGIEKLQSAQSAAGQ